MTSITILVQARQWLTELVLAVIALFFLLASSAALAAITFDPTPSTGGAGLTQMEIIQDTGNATLSGEYLGVRFSSSTPLTNVYARAIVGGVGYSLDATEAQDHFIGDLSGTAKTSYWFINYPTSGNGTFQVQIYVGNPATGGVLQGTSTLYTVSSANADNSASANKLVSVNVVPSSIQIGQNFNVEVCYSVNSTARMLLQPAINSAFDPNNLRLGNVVVDIYGSSDCTGASTSTLSNQLLFAGPVNSNSARAVYTFQTIGTTSVALTPIVSARSGIYKYNADFSTFPATIPAPINNVTLAKSVNITANSVGNITVTYTITATNPGSAAVVLDQIIDTLPSSPGAVTYTANSTTVNGTAQAAFNPVISGQTLTWSSTGSAGTTFTVPAAGTLTLGFNAVIPVANGVYTNSAIAKINTAQIDTTASLGDNAPATAITRIGPPVLAVTKTADTPTVVNTATGTTARYTIKVANTGTIATGVKLNDTLLPTGFTYLSTVAVNTPTSGTCTTAATRTTTVNPTVGATSPSWGDFSIPGGCDVSIQFDAAVASTVANGTYSNSATTTTSTAGATITNFDGTPVATTVDNVTVTSAVLAVTKTTSTPTIVNTATGTSATYTLTVTNSGTANATGVKVIDTLAAGFTYGSTTSITLNGTAVLAANFQTITTGTQTTATPQWDTAPTGGFTVNAGQTLVITFVANVASTVTDGTYNNSASASATNTSNITNFDGTPVATTVDNVAVTSAVLAVTKTTSTPTIVNTATGTTATYTLTVTNSGSANATGVKVTDTLPTGFSYASTSSLSLNGSAVAASGYSVTGTTTPQWDTAPTGGFTINAGQTLVITFVANVANTVANGTYNNSASASSTNASSITNFDGTPAATTSDNVTVTSAILAVTKTTSTPTIVNTATGTTATYTLTVTNSGSANAAGVKVTDTLPTGFSYASTSSLSLNGSAVAASGYSVTGTTTPQWDTAPTGGFTINAGQTLVITFVANVANTVANGTYNNSASATSTNASSITNFNGTASTTEDVTVTGAVSVGVSLFGTVYNDSNHNLQLDSNESGTGLTLFAKLIVNGGSSATQAVAINTTTGIYNFSSVSAGTYTIILDDNSTLTDITPNIPVGWLGTEMPDFTRNNVLVSTVDLNNLNFGLFNGSKLSGTVFADTGITGGTANNGIKDGGELGIAAVTVKASTGATIHDTAITDGAGSYTLWIPAAATSPVLITETNLSGYLSTGGSTGNTAGTYTRTSDSTSFTFSAGNIYTNVNFGDVPVNTFAANGLQSGLPGSVVFYAHQFDAGSAGTVVFSSASAPDWPTILYRDLNCNGIIDATDTVLTSASVVAGGQICVINKVTIPTGTGLGLQANTTVQAVFTYINASPALSSTLSVIDTTTVGAVAAGLVLKKAVDKATALAGDTVTYTLTYQNNSNVPLASIVINDATPAYTTFLSATCVLPLPAAITACVALPVPAVAGVGTIKWTLTGTLSPSATGQVSYSVKVDN